MYQYCIEFVWLWYVLMDFLVLVLGLVHEVLA